MSREICIYSSVQRLDYDEDEIHRVFDLLDECSERSIPDGELSLAFLDNETMRVMHGEFLGDPAPTDVITFPGDPENDFAGEICISAEYAMEYAEGHGVTLSEEITLYMIHGWLHLSELGDQTPEDAAKMREEEAKMLQALKAQGAIPSFVYAGISEET
ncbi:MAG: rRNA maturation RNase YbeY [Puniceicoccales bacterium]|jgi:probable rRNA maturation factor|nr:rRNA maturation RNase YbeY [Puniceicoccales bacterium]